jgi:hypothetical protein
MGIAHEKKSWACEKEGQYQAHDFSAAIRMGVAHKKKSWACEKEGQFLPTILAQLSEWGGRSRNEIVGVRERGTIPGLQKIRINLISKN